MRTALVTGATSGIGRAIALGLRADGLHVIALGRNLDGLGILARDHGIETMALDVNDRAGLVAAFASREIDVLVNNAGVLRPLTAFQRSEQYDIDITLQTNVASVLFLTRLVVPGMCARGSGHVFFTGSTAGHAPFQNFATYCASKAAIAGFAGALRLDLAPFGVRVTEIVAGRVETDLYNDLLPEEARVKMYANKSAVQPEDVSAMVRAVLKMPPNVDVARFDILPTYQATATGGQKQG